MADTLSEITNFFQLKAEDNVIHVGDPKGVEKFYAKLREQGYNLDELQAILDNDKNMLIVSCAGSGKTTTLILKIIRDILSGKLLKVVSVGGTNYLHIRPILVSTFLKSGAKELADKFDDMCKQFNIVGVKSSQIAFRTIHSEVYSALKAMGVDIKIVTDINPYLKEACRVYKVRSIVNKGGNKVLTADELADVSCILSYARNRLDNSRYNHPLMSEYNLDEITLKGVIAFFNQLKSLDKVQDFEDLEEILYDGYSRYPNVLNYVKSRYDYIYVDEFQDTSQLQYAILKPYFESAKGFLCVGDEDQCLLGDTELITEQGKKKIKDISVKDRVLTGVGQGDIAFKEVERVSRKKINQDIVVIETESGKVIKGTPEHIVFTKLPPIENIVNVYLMYRKDIGFRIGQTIGSRSGQYRKKRVGVAQRINREKGERVWIIKECSSIEEAKYWEMFYSYKYGIPQYVFKVEKNPLYSPSLSQEDVIKLHKDLNSYQRGLQLLQDLGYDFKYPHFIPKTKNNGYTLVQTVFGGSAKRNSKVFSSVIQIDTTDFEGSRIFENYLNVSKRNRKDRKDYWSYRNTSMDLNFQEDKIKEIEKICELKNVPLNVKKQIKLTDTCYDFMPMSNVIEGMLVPVLNGEDIKEEKVIKVYTEKYEDYVYDISIPETHNFVANSIFVHNCIYGWRGSDVSLIQEKFEQEYHPEVMQLTVNRRCTKKILEGVIPSIEKNTTRHKKQLRAAKDGGEVVVVVDGGVNYLAKSIQEDLKSSQKIGILGRTNADLLIPALLLLLEGYNSFSISKSLSLSDRIPSQVLGCLSLITQRYNANFASYLKLFLSKYNSFQATKLCDILSTSSEYSLLTLPLEDIQYSAPDLFSLIRTLRNDYAVNPIQAYITLLERMEQDVYNGKTIYAQRARDFTYYIRKIVQEHDAVKNLTVDQLYTLFNDTWPRELSKHKPIVHDNNNPLIDTNIKSDEAYVKISTVHEAKGKEWDYVYIWNDVNGCFPNSVGNRELTKEEYEEERRVHYIAWTRPTKKLIIFTRSDRNDGFLEECDLENAEFIEMDETKTKVRGLDNFSKKEVFRKKNNSDIIQNTLKVEKSWKDAVREYVLKYTNYNYICTVKGSNLDIYLTKLGGLDGLLTYLEQYKLEGYPFNSLEDVISDILESNIGQM